MNMGEYEKPAMRRPLRERILAWWSSVANVYKAAPAITGLVTLNVLIYIVMLLNGVNVLSATGVDYVKWGANQRSLALTGEGWRMLTCNFLHAGFPHILMNGALLLLFGFFSEMILGWRRCLVVYVLTGLYSSYFTILFYANTPSLGASGALSGYVGVIFIYLLLKANRKDMWDIFKGLGLFLLYNIFYGLFMKNVNLAAHAGGFLAGVVLGGCYAFLDNDEDMERNANYPYIIPEIILLIVFFFLFQEEKSKITEKDIMLRKAWDSGYLEKAVKKEKAKGKTACLKISGQPVA